MPKRITITLSDDLHAAANLLRKRRKYRTLSEYFAALARYDGQSQRDHHLTAEWAAMSGHERDRLDAAILRQVETGKGVRGSWLEARIDECVKRHLAAGQTPTTTEVAVELAQKIAEEGT
jgi:metal-responsive CopG/Arc/MetJ family transcriptional regulator